MHLLFTSYTSAILINIDTNHRCFCT